MIDYIPFIFTDLGKFDQVDGVTDLFAVSGEAIVIPMPYINTNPALSLITWANNSVGMNEEGTQHHLSLNGSLVLLDRSVHASGSRYSVEVVNGNANGFETGPTYREIITGNV